MGKCNWLSQGNGAVKLMPLTNPTGLWLAWTPTWTNLTVGDGTVTARYSLTGKTVAFHITFVYGTTSAVSGAITWTLPVTSISYAGANGTMPIGQARILDSGVNAFGGACFWLTTTTAKIQVQNAAATYINYNDTSSTAPMTWGTNDQFSVWGNYEAA